MVSVRSIRKSSRIQKQTLSDKKIKFRKILSPVLKRSNAENVKNPATATQKQTSNEDGPILLDVLPKRFKRDKKKLINSREEILSTGIGKSMASSPNQVFDHSSQVSECQSNKQSIVNSVTNIEDQVSTRRTRKSNPFQKQRSDDDMKSVTSSKKSVSPRSTRKSLTVYQHHLPSENTEKSLAMTVKQTSSLNFDKPLSSPEKQVSQERITRRSLALSQKQISNDKNAPNSATRVKRKSLKSNDPVMEVSPRQTRKSLEVSQQNILNETTTDPSADWDKSTPSSEEQVTPQHIARPLVISLQQIPVECDQNSITPVMKQKSLGSIEKQVYPKYTRSSSHQHISNNAQQSVKEKSKINTVKETSPSSSALPVKHMSDSNKSLLRPKEQVPAQRTTRRSFAISQQQTPNENVQNSVTTMKQKSFESDMSLTCTEEQVSPRLTRRSQQLISNENTLNSVTPVRPNSLKHNQSLAHTKKGVSPQQNTVKETTPSLPALPVKHMSSDSIKSLPRPEPQIPAQRTTRQSFAISQQQTPDENVQNSVTPVKQKSFESEMSLACTEQQVLPRLTRRSQQLISNENTLNSVTPVRPNSLKYNQSLARTKKCVSPQQNTVKETTPSLSALPVKHTSSDSNKSLPRPEAQAQIPAQRTTRRSFAISQQQAPDENVQNSVTPVKQKSFESEMSLTCTEEQTSPRLTRRSQQLIPNENTQNSVTSIKPNSLKYNRSLAGTEKCAAPQQIRKSLEGSQHLISNETIPNFPDLPVTFTPEDCDKSESSTENQISSKRSSSLGITKQLKSNTNTQNPSVIPAVQKSSKSVVSSKKKVSSRRRSLAASRKLMSVENTPNSTLSTIKKSSKHVRSVSNPKKLAKTKKSSKSRASSGDSPMPVDVLSISRLSSKSSVTFQEQSFKKSKTSPAIMRTAAKYKKYLEDVPLDNLMSTRKDPLQSRKTYSDSKKPGGKNTLKRKRYTIASVRLADEGYEDDIYESEKFANFKDLFATNTPGSTYSFSMKTPELGFYTTPRICSKKTPVFKDCFSPTEFALQRKVAEECYYRNKKRKSASKTETPKIPEKKKLEFNEALSKACEIQEAVENLRKDDGSEEDDSYFSDD